MPVKPRTIGYFKPSTLADVEVLSTQQPPGESIALVSSIEVDRYVDEKLEELKQRCATACKDVFDAYWHRGEGSSVANRGALAKVAQDCEEAIKHIEIK